MSRCRSCGAEVVWVTLRPGPRKAPLDAEPVPDGNVMADLAAGMGLVLTEAMRAIVRTETPDEPLYRSHFSTCPDAKTWRRR